MHAYIRELTYHLPERVVDNAELERLFPEWPAEKILAKTGIAARQVAGPDETASDLAVAAAEKLFRHPGCDRRLVDYVLFCTQTPDYLLPTTACLVQDRLGLPTTAGALDINLGCSGYVYGLGLASGLIRSGQAENILLLTADTYTKLLNPRDRAVRSLFGDAAAATLVSSSTDPATSDGLGSFVTGTDGAGWRSLIVPRGGMRGRELVEDWDQSSPRSDNDLYMNGPEIFSFALRVVPPLVDAVLTKAGLRKVDVDLFIPHQANAFMLHHLRDKLGIDPARFYVDVARYGNTVSSTIPIALADAVAGGRVRAGDRLLLAGFGVGFSWAGCLARWSPRG